MYGRPVQVRTDRGREFYGAFRQFLDSMGISHILVHTVTPWENGIAERMVRTVKGYISRVVAVNGEVGWIEIIPFVQHAINVTVSRGT